MLHVHPQATGDARPRLVMLLSTRAVEGSLPEVSARVSLRCSSVAHQLHTPSTRNAVAYRPEADLHDHPKNCCVSALRKASSPSCKRAA